jgi:hypothetical protein
MISGFFLSLLTFEETNRAYGISTLVSLSLNVYVRC